MRKRLLRISIVIPAYNEESHIGSCLEAISKLEVKPYEVIVVDNLSTDNTAKVVEHFPFAKLVKENKQGLVHARDCGFNAASGDIIGRIDSDTLLPSDWTKRLQEIFTDNSVQAVTGGLHFYDIGWPRVIDGIDAYWRAWMAKHMESDDRVFLFGSNMAVRKSAWVAVRDHVCRESGTHEDLDLSIHMSEDKLKVIFDPKLMANVSARRIDTSLFALSRYAFDSPLTYIKHDAKEHRYMYPLIAIVLFDYVILRLLFRAFDSQAQKLSLKVLLLSQSAARANPADLT